jgi:hypothetical protein
MKLLYCWRCERDVPMLDESEFAAIRAAYSLEVAEVQQFRRLNNAGLAEAITAVPSRVLPMYEEMAISAGFEALQVAPEHVIQHRIAGLGAACRTCGKPLRTPAAKLCAECGATVDA